MAYDTRRAALIRYVIDALRPRGPLRVQSKSAPFGSPYALDYMDLINNHGVTVDQVKTLRAEMDRVFPMMKALAKKHQAPIIMSAQVPRAPGP